MRPCTPEGYKRLKEELDNLISKERPKVISEIATARSYGDLKENAEYHSAKEKQGLIEARISQLQDILSNIDVIEISQVTSDKVQFGATVKYKNLATNKISEWQLIGSDEIGMQENKMSIVSPIGKALLGKKKGDTLNVSIPKGDITLKVMSVKYN